MRLSIGLRHLMVTLFLSGIATHHLDQLDGDHKEDMRACILLNDNKFTPMSVSNMSTVTCTQIAGTLLCDPASPDLHVCGFWQRHTS